MKSQEHISINRPLLEPKFHYIYKNQAVVVDSQYNNQGNLLGVCNSHGEIFIYASPTSHKKNQENRKVKISFSSQKNYPLLKLAWSFHRPNLLASSSIDNEITLYEATETKLNIIKSITTETIPVYLTFYPGTEELLSVGFSNGTIGMYDKDLNLICQTQAHQQTVNCLNWQRKMTDLPENQWVKEHFPQFIKYDIHENPLLLSGSSDCFCKIWKYSKGKLTQIYTWKAHEKQIRQVQWKPTQDEKYIVTCSEDGFVKFWAVQTGSKGIEVIISGFRDFEHPVYRAEYNVRGDLIGISYCNEEEERVATVISREEKGVLIEEKNLSH